MTGDEKNELIKKIEDLTNLKNELKNEEQAIKLTMNSIYGAIGNNWFVCFNPDVAEAVTLQGQDLIKYSEKIIFKYFNEHWHQDKELHEKLGLTSVKKVNSPLTIYGDTDSNYVTFQEVLSSCDWKGDPKDLILKINEYRLKDYLKNCLKIYSKKWGTENYQDFELENIAINGIFLGKKKYVANLVYEDGVHIDPLSRMKIVGVEMIKGGTPPFVRKKLEYLTKFIFSKGKNFDIMPPTSFYDYIYLIALVQNKKLADNLLKYEIFTDIEFNFKKQINCQARSAAIFVFLSKNKLLEKYLSSYENFKSIYTDILFKI
jgi:DNA polymerase elongation subunit (family B)